MKYYLTVIWVLLSALAYGQKEIYEHPRFEELSMEHKSLAILPFRTFLKLKDSVGRQESDLARKEGYAVQEALELYFSQKNKKRKTYVRFQNVDNTNALLLQNQITYENIDQYTTENLCEILGVDGIISGHLNISILLSEGLPENFNLLEWFGASNYGRIGIKISDGNTGKLLWKYEKVINRKTGKNTRELIEKMMKQASRQFPYEKERKVKRKSERKGN